MTDESHWPIVVHETIGIPDDACVDAFIRRADFILSRREPYVVIFDSRRAGRATAYMRKRNLEWLRVNESLLAEHCVGLAMVLSSATLRFVMSTVMLVWRQPVPYEIVSDLNAAIVWGEERLVAGDTRRAAGD